MRKIYYVLKINILIIFLTTSSQALNFKELENYLQNNSGIVSAIYVYQRCTAITHFTHLKLKKSGNDKAREMKLISDHFFILAENFYKKHNDLSDDISQKKTLEVVKKMIKLYEEDAEEMRIKNGLIFSGIISKDIKTCQIAYKKTREFLLKKQNMIQ